MSSSHARCYTDTRRLFGSPATRLDQARVVFSKLVFLPGAYNYRLPFLRCSLNVCTCRLKGREPWSAGWQARRVSSNSTSHWMDRYSSLSKLSGYQIISILELLNFLIFLFKKHEFFQVYIIRQSDSSRIFTLMRIFKISCFIISEMDFLIFNIIYFYFRDSSFKFYPQ